MQEQAIRTPFGISVFGSALLRVDPDHAVLRFAVARLAPTPREAFAAAREGASQVRAFVVGVPLEDVASARVTLTKTMRFANGEHRFEGYTARVGFQAKLGDLDRLEETLAGIVEAGADEVTDVALESNRLKELRAQARREAVAAAREKADVYAEAAGVAVGAVVHIEDVSPDRLGGREAAPMAAGGFVGRSPAIEAGVIVVGGAVVVGFELARAKHPKRSRKRRASSGGAR